MLVSPLSSPKIGTRAIRYGIILVCEDTNSNYQYLKDKISTVLPHPIAVSVYTNAQGTRALLQSSEDVGHTNPRDLAIYAIAQASQKNQEYQDQDGDEPLFYREVYCIADVDDNISNGTLSKAYELMDEAQDNNPRIHYRMVMSNECFEVWYILHFQDLNEPLYRGTKPQKEAGLILADYSNRLENRLKSAIQWSSMPLAERTKKIKSYPHFFKLMTERGDEAAAIQRAKTLLSSSRASRPYDNPSTELSDLIERINRFKTV